MGIFVGIVRVFAGLALLGLFLYIRFKSYERKVKDLGDGKIQTIFGNDADSEKQK